MFRKPIVGGIILLFLLSSIIPIVSSDTLEFNKTLYVGDNVDGDYINVNTGNLIGFFKQEYCIENRPPEPPIIKGPTEVKPRNWYIYSLFSTDPDGDDIYYRLNYGEEYNPHNWIGPWHSGKEINISVFGLERVTPLSKPRPKIYTMLKVIGQH